MTSVLKESNPIRTLVMVRMFITNLKSILKIRLKAHIFPRTFADLLPLLALSYQVQQ